MSNEFIEFASQAVGVSEEYQAEWTGAKELTITAPSGETVRVFRPVITHGSSGNLRVQCGSWKPHLAGFARLEFLLPDIQCRLDGKIVQVMPLEVAEEMYSWIKQFVEQFPTFHQAVQENEKRKKATKPKGGSHE